MDLTENKRAVDAFTYGAGTSGYPPQELLAALLTLDGASLTSGEVEELRRRYTERITSRLLDGKQCMLLQFLGDDVRRNKA